MFSPLSIPGCVLWYPDGYVNKYVPYQKHAACRPKETNKGLYFDGQNDYLVIDALQLKKPVTILIVASLETHNKKTVLFKTAKQELFLINNRLRYSTGSAVYLDNVDTNGVYGVRDYKTTIMLNYNNQHIVEESLLNTPYDSTMYIGGFDGCKYPLHGYLHHLLIYENAIGNTNLEQIMRVLCQ
jgi:hypothetical protein